MSDPSPSLEELITKAKQDALHAKRERGLAKSSGTGIPARGAIFVLSELGHKRAGYSDAEAKTIFDQTMLYAKHLNAEAQRDQEVGYDVYEIHVFQTLEDLLRKRPNASLDRKWHQVIIVTHAQASQPQELENAIFFGDREYSALDLQEFGLTRAETVRGFRQAVEPGSTMRVIGCSPASHGPELGIYLRELIGTHGAVAIPRVDVDFTPKGFLGTPVPGTGKLRALKPEEWLEIPAIPEANRP